MFVLVQYWLDVLANGLTVVLGIGGLIGLWVNRGKISSILRYLKVLYLMDRANHVRPTLEKLSALSYDNKDHRAEILALMGQLSGQLKALGPDYDTLSPIITDLDAIQAKTLRLTEGKNREIQHLVEGSLAATIHNTSPLNTR